ncbi:hypothetical protein GCM10010371_19260 [Streptomyces subrutilus]|uniref:Uncharacterized protein n=1 Tax=Streptomyces subrutilus TaxID=36818 RepID=A0A918QMY3_9ACTN|nr:hypothetical protein GCM10010371_19260 [Streptomyces subrutilus]
MHCVQRPEVGAQFPVTRPASLPVPDPLQIGVQVQLFTAPHGSPSPRSAVTPATDAPATRAGTGPGVRTVPGPPGREHTGGRGRTGGGEVSRETSPPRRFTVSAAAGRYGPAADRHRQLQPLVEPQPSQM